MILMLMIFMSFADDFCDGFEKGYKAERGNIAVVPVCPVQPVTPVNSNDYLQGIKKGVEKAEESDDVYEVDFFKEDE